MVLMGSIEGKLDVAGQVGDRAVELGPPRSTPRTTKPSLLSSNSGEGRPPGLTKPKSDCYNGPLSRSLLSLEIHATT
jgi:hypothetical protein